MTALTQYEKLETTALWRPAPDAQRREVVVAMGDASLIISGLSDRPLSHWSLPAIDRLNPGKRPALYAPGADADETLEIDEPDMIAAIETLRGAIDRSQPHPGRLRFALTALLAATCVLLAVYWLPGTLMRQTAEQLPASKRAALGVDILNEINMLSGQPCRDEAGVQAMSRLARRVLGPDAPLVLVLPELNPGTAHLPGPVLLLDRGVVENFDTAETVAGFLLAEDLRSDAMDPTLRLLQDTGLWTTARFLTSGEMPQPAAHAHATTLMTQPPVPLADSVMLPRFEAAQISSQPYAYALDITGETTVGLIEADPMRGRAEEPLLNDQDWVALQEICGG